MKKILTIIVLPAIIIALGYLIVESIQEPVRFKNDREKRENVAIQILKDIRTLQVAYKGHYGKFTPSMDSLLDFYHNGKITIVKQIGSMDDSVAVANTEALRKKNRKITPEELYAHYQKGMNVVVAIETPIAVKDTLLKRADFNPELLKSIPFSEGKPIIMNAVTKMVSGVEVPLFEACMPFSDLLKGLNHQLIVNLNAERNDTGRYPGLKVGSVDAPNNNAGNWE
ncbi:MAG: hypothetical protein IJB58_02160 [Bacteroidales bacterium]|nr:hypothetical protein [Bacteroidales bacterium]